MEQAMLLFTAPRSTPRQKRHHESQSSACGIMSSMPLGIRPSPTEDDMTSNEWNKDFEIASISRRDLETLGLSSQKVDLLTDTDMQHIAQEMANLYVDHAFWSDLRFIVRIVLAEKEARNAPHA
jgi:hypothetical protein